MLGFVVFEAARAHGMLGFVVFWDRGRVTGVIDEGRF